MLTSDKIKIEHYKCQRDKHNSTNDKCYKDLGIQLSEACILSVPSIPTGGD
jgi:hypothetical protein